MKKLPWYYFISLIFVLSCKKNKEELYVWKNLEVTATAYNSVPSQTQGNPFITAWGDTLTPETKSIAVSRNLISLGLKHDTPIKIEGFDSIYFVKDKMNKRWTNRIDIYMGTNVKKAKNWGRKKLTIQYRVPKDSITLGTNVK